MLDNLKFEANRDEDDVSREMRDVNRYLWFIVFICGVALLAVYVATKYPAVFR